MNFKKLHLVVTTVLTLVSASAFAQDRLAKQAPVDKNMRSLDTLKLRKAAEREEAQMPATALYDEWSNKYAHKTTELPETYKINLRGFHMPTDSRVVTSNYGARWGRQHKGLDIKVYIGDTIRAAFSGKVRVVKYEAAGYGKYVVIRHNNGLETVYGHMSDWLVKENQTVKAGQPIGLGGNTGRSTGSHLHFETRLCGVALNPALLFDFRNQDVVGDYYIFRKSTFQSEAAKANELRGKVGNGSYRPSDVRGETAPGSNEVVSQSSKKNSESTKIENSVSSARKANVQNVEVRYHKVAVGESLQTIAKRRGISVEELCKLNHLTRDIKVRPGQLLRYS